ncbi:MAG: hypothetical protein EP329_09425 [Deltaproteobacteria bacterium]|nr:MAG: hypothetical protein EP329_09425 [Deltaproteobacteria bacterium]
MFGHSDVMKRYGMGRAVDLAGLEAELVGVDEAARVALVRSLTKADMAALWDACVGQGCTAEDFVPAETPLGAEVVHAGKNSLPAFSAFEKRFCAADGRPGVVYGYNHNWFNFTTAGPGYFVGRYHDDARAEFGLNYYEVPPGQGAVPRGWPRIRRNELGLQLLIYARMIDYMRKVAPGVTIGRAWRQGKKTSNYFVLCRTGA